MKLKVKLSVSDEAFYEVLMNSVKDDIYKSTGKNIEPYEGFEYVRKLPSMVSKNQIDTKYFIQELVENQKYNLNIITPAETTIVQYTITKLSGNEILVEYIEDSISNKALAVINGKIFRFVFSFLFGKRKMKKKLREVEAYINQKND